MGVDRDTQRRQGHGLGDRRVDGLLRGGVGAHVAHAELALQFLALVVGQVGDDDLGARGVQPAHGRLTQATRAADDDRGAPGDLHMIPLLATGTLDLRE